MKRIILFLFAGIFLSLQLSAQMGFTDDFEDGSQDWWDNGYALNESDGNLKITSRSRGTWRAFGYDLSTAVDVSSNEIMNLTLKTNDLTPCKLTAYISDGTNNVPITKRVLPTENYITLHYDFSGDGDIDYTNITQIFFL